MTDIFDEMLDFDNKKPFKKAAGGKYRATIIGTASCQNPHKGTKGFEITLVLQNALSGQDVEGIDLNKIKPRDTHWVTENSREVVMDRFFRKVMPDIHGQHSIPELLDQVIGKDVVVNLEREPYTDSQGRERDRFVVVSYEAA